LRAFAFYSVLHDPALEGELKDRMGLVADMLLDFENKGLPFLSGALVLLLTTETYPGAAL
jgi:hypothetical protein